MEDCIRKSGLLTASKVLGIIQAVCLGLCVPIMFLGVVVSLFSMVGFGMFLCLFIWSTVTFILAILGSVYAHKAQKYWCREYATIAGAMFIILSVINLSLFSVLCACFCMSERNKLNQDTSINIRKPIITWSIIGGISIILVCAGVVVGLVNIGTSANKINDYYNTSDYEDYTTTDDVIDVTESGSKNNKSSEAHSDDYEEALDIANTYAKEMYFSKDGLYEQLTSDYGEGYSDEVAQYAINNLEGVDYKENALKQAEYYYTELDMPKDEIREYLVSDVGDMFTEEEADYAIESLK